MRLPTRLDITWKDENTLQIGTDAGMQTRLFYFDGSKWSGGQPTWQGDSVAKWEKLKSWQWIWATLGWTGVRQGRGLVRCHRAHALRLRP
jgi:hypothetical protein